jgi:hypothetical protein
LAFPLCSSLKPLQLKVLLLVLQGRVVIFTVYNCGEITHNRKGYNFPFLEIRVWCFTEKGLGVECPLWQQEVKLYLLANHTAFAKGFTAVLFYFWEKCG